MRKIMLTIPIILILVLALSSCSMLAMKPSADQPTESYYEYEDDQVIEDGNGYFGLSALVSEGSSETGPKTEHNTKTDTEINTDTETDSEEEKYVNPYSVWGSVYSEFNSFCDNAYNTLLDATEKNGYYGPDTQFLLNGNTELSLCASFFSSEAPDTEGVFQSMGYTSVKYRDNGPSATVSAVDANGEDVVFSFEFDGENSAQLVCERAGQIDFMMSICVTDTYWAKVYKGIKNPCEVHIIGNLNNEFYMFYEPDKALEDNISLLAHEEIALDDSFAQNLGYSMLIDNNELKIISPD